MIRGRHCSLKRTKYGVVSPLAKERQPFLKDRVKMTLFERRRQFASGIVHTSPALTRID
jgi:hypothetical protein